MLSLLVQTLGTCCQTIQQSQAMFHQVHTPRQEQDASSTLDGDQECERKEKRTLFSGSMFSGNPGQGTPKFAQGQGSARGGKVQILTKT